MVEKVYFVTGSSSGIGREIALELAEPGVKLFIHGRNPAKVHSTALAIQSKGAKVEELVCDFERKEEVSQLIEKLQATSLTGLVNNAGMAIVKPFDSLTIEEWESSLAVNLTAPFLLTRDLVSRMAAGSCVVNVLSIAAKTAFGGWSTYCATKFALDGFSRAVREELRDRKIRVINVYPASTDTNIWDTITGDYPRGKMLKAVNVAKAVVFAMRSPAEVLIEDITLGSLTGRL